MKRLILAATAAALIPVHRRGGVRPGRDEVRAVRLRWSGLVRHSGRRVHSSASRRHLHVGGADRGGGGPRRRPAAGAGRAGEGGGGRVQLPQPSRRAERRARAGAVRQARDVADSPRGDHHLLRRRHRPAFRRRDGARHRQAGAQRDRGGRRRLHLRGGAGERHQRTGVAGERPAVVPGEGRRHVWSGRPGHGPRRRLQRPAAADPRERRGDAVAADGGPHLRPGIPGELRQPLRHAGAGRHDLHRHPGIHVGDAAGRCRRDRARARRRAAQHHRPEGARTTNDQ